MKTGFFSFIALALLLAGQASTAWPQDEPGQPNILILLVDDAAFMDFGVYGGEARTPNIDALAARGAMFTGFRTSPLCAPSRAMLLTGMDNHQTGVATIPEVLTPEQKGQPGYAMALEPGVATLATRLKPAGYRTLMTGKWHLGSGPGDLPSDHGFDRSFSLDASGADNWEDKSYMPYYREAPWYEDGQPAQLPEDFYSSDFIVDKMIEYLDATPDEAPFLALLGFMAVHIPVQAPAHLTAGYDGTYDAGWDALRTARWERAQALGLIPEGAPLNPMPESFRRWEDMPRADQRLYAARMQVNAAMLEAMDIAIGRLMDRLRADGLYDNTIILVLSDNGPEPTRADDDFRMRIWMYFNDYHLNLDGMGERGSYGFIGPEWAMAAASPLNLFKFSGAEGGLRVPLIMAGPGIAEGRRVDAFTFVTDIVPTLFEIIGVPLVMEEAHPITGRSLLPLLTDSAEAIYSSDEAVGMNVSGNSAIYMGRWKITRSQGPHGDGLWRLFDLETDPGETRDWSTDEPEVMDRMLAAYAEYSARVGVIEVPPGYSSHAQLVRNTTARQISRYGSWALGGILALVALLYGVWRAFRRKPRKVD
ncbi:MAG: sulfatase-like hydrolase/transferase [Hyphomonas sp.]